MNTGMSRMNTGGRTLWALLCSACLLSACSQHAAAPVHINLPGRSVQAPFSDAVLVGNTLYMAGRLGTEPGTTRVPADPAAEARLLLDGFRAVLAEAGMQMKDIVSVQVFCSDVALFDTWNQVYRQYFSEPFPARAFIGSGPLLFGARFEMQAIAVKQ